MVRLPLNGVLNLVTINPKPEMVNKMYPKLPLYDEPKNKAWIIGGEGEFARKNGTLFTRVDNPCLEARQLFMQNSMADLELLLQRGLSAGTHGL